MCLTPNMSKIVNLKADAQRNHYCCKMHLAPNMYKIINLKANAQKIVTLKCIWCQNICTKPSLCRVIHGFFPSNDICICKCSPWEFSDKCDQVLYYCSFLHLQCSHSCTLKICIAVENSTIDRQVRNLFNYVCHYTRSYIEICMPVDDFWVANM